MLLTAFTLKFNWELSLVCFSAYKVLSPVPLLVLSMA